MASQENLYSSFQIVDEEEFLSYFKKLGEAILVIPKEILYFANVALSKNCMGAAKKKVTLDTIKSSEATETVAVLCIDDPVMLTKICKKLELVPKYKKHIIMIPRYSPSCQSTFEKIPNHEDIHITEFHAEIIPIAPDKFIVPVPLAYNNCFCEADISDVYTISRALLRLTLIHGFPSRVFTAGTISRRVYELMQNLKHQICSDNSSTYFSTKGAKYDDLFIIDRSCDNITPFVTQCTYAGRLDEAFNPKYGFMELPDGIQLEGYAPNSTIRLDDNDLVYKEVKSMNIAFAFDWMRNISTEATKIQGLLNKTRGTPEWRQHSRRATEILKIRPFNNLHYQLIDRIPMAQTYVKHMRDFQFDVIFNNSTDFDQIYDFIHRGRYSDALQMLILSSVTSDGIPQSQLKKFEEILLSLIGFDFVPDWIRLQAGGLITPRTFLKFGSKFSTVMRELKLLIDDEKAPTNDFYAGYYPITARLVENCLKTGWGPSSVCNKTMKNMGIELNTYKVDEQQPPKKSSDGKPFRRVLVFVVGGMTISEMSIFEKMGEQLFSDNQEFSYQFHCGSTDLITGTRLVKTICPSLAKNTI